jgi:hypothetical protein
VHPHQRVPHFAPAVSLLQHIAQRIKIPERLRHLLPLHHEVRAMQPVADELLPRASFRLCDLRFVMRKNVVHPAAVNIELLTEKLRRHRAALDVPSRPPWSPRTLPFYRPIFFIPRLPEREIADVLLLILIIFHPAGRTQLRQIDMSKPPVIGKFVDPKIDRLVVRLVGQPSFLQRLDHLDHFLDLARIGRFGKKIRPFDSQRIEIVEERFLERRGELGQRDARLP